MSKAKEVLGKDLMLFVETKALALATSCKLGLSAETIDTQSKDSGIWTEKDIKKLSWNASSDNLFSADADANSYDKLFALFIAHKPVTLNFGIIANADVNEMPADGWTLSPGSYTGKAVITSLEANAPDGDKATFSISFEGTGPIKKATSAPASK
ncbi:phage tail tube protein [Bacteroides faecis]|jgi:TP901-1 family phage major tail protein|uniref:phage tail tube protein n=1 Tax=Bacteroides faecis TaxID=674529 RepID=UPI001D06C02E|nr:phage tail tube protein [Bacteroides faecis]MCB6635308.1 phage tail protein [Bacteroides faecis]MCE8941590.1 phage tail protein [Bacteroides faecis]